MSAVHSASSVRSALQHLPGSRPAARDAAARSLLKQRYVGVFSPTLSRLRPLSFALPLLDSMRPPGRPRELRSSHAHPASTVAPHLQLHSAPPRRRAAAAINATETFLRASTLARRSFFVTPPPPSLDRTRPTLCPRELQCLRRPSLMRLLPSKPPDLSTWPELPRRRHRYSTTRRIRNTSHKPRVSNAAAARARPIA